MKILIAGYYGFGNLGDELVLSSVLSQLRERYDRLSVTVLSSNPAATTSYHRVRAVSRWNPLTVLAEIWRNDFFDIGRGRASPK